MTYRVDLVPIADIRVNPENPRTINDVAFKKLVASVKSFPEMLHLRPVVVDDEGVILGGNMRYQACVAAGMQEIPVVHASNLTAAQKKEFVVKDNVSGGEWDYEKLLAEWDSSALAEWGLDIRQELLDENAGVVEDEYEMPPEEKIKTTIQVGDVYRIGPHTLACCDSTDPKAWQKILAGQMVDCVVTDPPYNVDYTGATKDSLKIQNDNMPDAEFYNFLLAFHCALYTNTRPGGSWYVWHADSEGLNFRKAFIDSGLLLKQNLIWVKNSMVLGRQDYQWRHEPCLYGWKPGAAHYFTPERTKTTVIEDQVDLKSLKKDELLKMLEEVHTPDYPTTVIRCEKPTKNAQHPTMKPVKLIAGLIKNSTKTGQIIGDGFLGSGTTMVAAHQLKRVCCGTELDPRYCQVVMDRMLALDTSLQVEKI